MSTHARPGMCPACRIGQAYVSLGEGCFICTYCNNLITENDLRVSSNDTVVTDADGSLIIITTLENV